MPWFQVDDQLPVHKKVMAAGNAAMGLWVRAGSWCQQNLTGGFVPTHVVKTLGTFGQAKALVTAGLWHPVTGGYHFHDWDEHQMSVDEIRERKRKRAEAGRLGGKASGESRRGAGVKPSAEASASNLISQVPNEKQTPVPGPALSLVTSGGELTSVGDPEPPRFCSDHPDDTADPCIPCQQARLTWKAWKARQPERERRLREERQRVQQNCSRCHGTNTYEDDNGEIRPCQPHLEAAHA